MDIIPESGVDLPEEDAPVINAIALFGEGGPPSINAIALFGEAGTPPPPVVAVSSIDSRGVNEERNGDPGKIACKTIDVRVLPWMEGFGDR